jgi:hypothetical protein
MMSDPVDLSQRRAALVDARKNEKYALRADDDAMLEYVTILADTIEQMWDAGGDRSQIVRALRWAADKMDSFREEDQI